MKKFIIVEICVVIAIAFGFWIGRITSPFNDYVQYYENSDKAWDKLEELNDPPVTYDDPDKKRLRKVRAAYRAVFENYPDSRWADDAIYQLALLSRSNEEQFALFRRLIRDYPDSEWADDSMYAVAFASYKIGEELQMKGTLESTHAYFDRALSLFNQLITIYPGSVLEEEAQFNIAMCYKGQGDFNNALAQLENLKIELGRSSIFAKVLYASGEIYYEQQDYENARIEFTNVVDYGDPEYAPSASFGVAQAYFKETKYEKAIEAYQKVIDQYSDTQAGQEAAFFIAQPYAELERYDEAIAVLDKAIEAYPNNKLVRSWKSYIGEVARAGKDTARAIETYQELANDPNNSYDNRLSAQYLIGEIYEEIGDIEQAIDAYEKQLDANEFPHPHRNASHASRKITENYIQKLKDEQKDEVGE